ncbi:hypothetical protein, partial [Curtobacterium citreum]|uniref:hypothetical protein n=1 Tax=Curtobacterium citreum TaxID=2036 RepID=UPI0019D4C3F9
MSTRDTVWCETPATRATSRMLGERGCCVRGDAIVALSCPGPWHLDVHVHIPSQIIMHVRGPRASRRMRSGAGLLPWTSRTYDSAVHAHP